MQICIYALIIGCCSSYDLNVHYNNCDEEQRHANSCGRR
jgi:hypothetical protein